MPVTVPVRGRGRPRKEDPFEVEKKPQGQIYFQDANGDLVEYKRPETDEEVQFYLKFFFGITLASTSCCPGHSAPLTAVCDAYFHRYPVVVWKASRGLGGKTTALAGL